MHLKNNHGFSIAELTVVIGLTAVLAAISLPMLNSSMRDMQLIADARSIAAKITYAKVAAMSQMTSYRISIVGSNQWKMEKYNRTSSAFELQDADHTLSEGVSNSGITFKATSDSAPSGFNTASSATITFNSRGIPTEGPRIVYISNNKKDFAVSVSLSGKVQFWRHQNSAWTTQ